MEIYSLSILILLGIMAITLLAKDTILLVNKISGLKNYPKTKNKIKVRNAIYLTYGLNIAIDLIFYYMLLFVLFILP